MESYRRVGKTEALINSVIISVKERKKVLVVCSNKLVEKYIQHKLKLRLTDEEELLFVDYKIGDEKC